jgi:hypothetical protein
MLKSLIKWLEDLINKAELDTESVSYFRGTKDSPYCIVGGWGEVYSEELADLLYISESNPDYAMCVKIVKQEASPDVNLDYLLEVINPETGEVEFETLPIERDDDLTELARFLLSEWERISKDF